MKFLSESDEAESTISSSSHVSRIVQNDWGDLDFLTEPIVTSKETQEARIIEDYELAMKAWCDDRLDDAFKRFHELSQSPLLVEQQVENFRAFDWPKAKKEFVSTSMPKIRQYFFAVHKNLARFVKDPTIHYLYVRSSR